MEVAGATQLGGGGRVSPLRDRAVLSLLVAETVSHAGIGMTWVALPWFVLTTTGSPTRMGMVMAAELLPVAILGIPAGAVVGRLGARRSMRTSDLARAVIMVVIPVLSLAGWLSFPTLLVLVLALGMFVAPYHSAQRVLLPQLVGEDERTVAQANALMQGSTRLATLLGPALGGVLIAAFRAETVLFIDAGTYLVAWTLITVGVPRARVDEDIEVETPRVLDGVRFLLKNRLLSRLTFGHTVTEMAFQGLFAALPVAVLVRYGGDPRLAGLFLASFGGGAVVGTIAVIPVVARVAPLLLAGLSAALGCVFPWLLAFDPPPWLVATTLALVGLNNPFHIAPLNSVMTLRSPPALRAQVLAASFTIILIAGPLGLILAGPALERFGPDPVFTAIAALATVGYGSAAIVCLGTWRRERAFTPVPASGTPRGS